MHDLTKWKGKETKEGEREIKTKEERKNDDIEFVSILLNTIDCSLVMVAIPVR